MDKELKFEEAIKRLEEIVEALEEGRVTLDESLSLFQEGIDLVKKCDQKLKNVEVQATKILEEGKESDFEVDK